MENGTRPRHTFAICAYKESPFLEDCIHSLKRQTAASDIICCTSTPNEFIRGMAKRYGIPLFVREGEPGIREDWLFAYQQAEGKLVTIAHQDDRYGKSYVKELLSCYERYPDMAVFMSDYVTLKTSGEGIGRIEKLERVNLVWLVKKLLRFPLYFKKVSDRSWVKKSALIFGNSVCCPSCAYHKDWIGERMFDSKFEFALDWDNLYELAGRKGRFVCVERPLIAYRVHKGATTKACIEDHRRTRDEIAMFEKMWPEPMVKILMYFYKKAYDAYEL